MNRYSDDAEMNAALEEDAAKLEAMGQDAGITLQDLDESPIELMECHVCEGSGKIVEEARTSGANQHSACQRDCDECEGFGCVVVSA